MFNNCLASCSLSASSVMDGGVLKRNYAMSNVFRSTCKQTRNTKETSQGAITIQGLYAEWGSFYSSTQVHFTVPSMCEVYGDGSDLV